MNGKIIKILAVVCLILAAVVLVNRLYLVDAYTADMEGIEQTFVFFTQRLLMHKTVYIQPDTEPFYMTQYSPASMYVYALQAKLMGIGAYDNLHRLYTAGRGLNLFLNIFSALLAGVIVVKILGRSKYLGIIAGCLSFAFFYTHDYAIRPDSVKSFVAISGMLFWLLYIKKQQLKWLVAACLLFALAVFSKQDAMYLFAAVAFYTLIYMRRKTFLVGSISVASLLVVGGIFYWLEGPEMILNMTYSLNQGITFEYYKMAFPHFLGPIMLGVILLFMLRKSRKLLQTEPVLLATLFFAGVIFVFASLFSIKFGANPVYYMDFIILFFIGLAGILGSERFKTQFNTFEKVVIVLVIALVLGREYNSGHFVKRIYNADQNKFEQTSYEELTQLATEFRDGTYPLQPGQYILTFNKALVNHIPDLVIFPTIEAEFPNLLMCREFFKHGPNVLYDYSRAEKMISDGRVPYVVVFHKCSWPEFLNLRQEDYELVATEFNQKVYRFKGIKPTSP